MVALLCISSLLQSQRPTSQHYLLLRRKWEGKKPSALASMSFRYTHLLVSSLISIPRPLTSGCFDPLSPMLSTCSSSWFLVSCLFLTIINFGTTSNPSPVCGHCGQLCFGIQKSSDFRKAIQCLYHVILTSNALCGVSNIIFL